MTAVVTVVFTSCPTRGGQQRNQFRVKVYGYLNIFQPFFFLTKTTFVSMTFCLLPSSKVESNHKGNNLPLEEELLACKSCPALKWEVTMKMVVSPNMEYPISVEF